MIKENKEKKFKLGNKNYEELWYKSSLCKESKTSSVNLMYLL